jgi:mannose-1-phosphate guanylyltransferase/phosphomannomutase
MKAIVLAAGKGERIRSVIDGIPKPMVPLDGQPILESNILWLKKHGVTDLYMNLHYAPEKIKEYFGGGEQWGVNITYSYEETLLGTAGAARKIADDLWDKPERFLLIYGDSRYEYDLDEIIRFHLAKQGVATIAIYRKDEVATSGIVLLDDDNRVTEFIEKPRPHEEISNLVNTGIYVLEPEILDYIPPGQSLDFGKDVFPSMVSANEKIFGIIVEGKLTAIDTPALYEQAVTPGQAEDS